MISRDKEIVLLSATTDASDVIGGGERYLPDVIPCMLDRGWRVVLAAPAASALVRLVSWPADLQIVPVDFPVVGGGVTAMAKAAKEFNALVRNHRQAVFHGNTYRSLKWLAFAKVSADVPTVCHLQESDYRQYYSLRARYFSRLTDEFVAISRAIQHEFQQGTGVPDSRFRLIPHGIPLASADKSVAARKDFWLGQGVQPDTSIICLVARTDPLKGHDILVDAFAGVVASHPQATLVMVGLQDIGPMQKTIYDRIQQKIAAYGIAAKVKIVPNVPYAREYMRHADVVVVPSTSEGLGRVAIEGQAERTCVVASATGGLVDVVTDQVTGRLVPPGDATALREVLLQVLRDDRLRQRLASQGHLNAQKRYSVDAMNNALESVWLRLLKKT
jgi:glycosyltransferase involved in cell wall biosynthesis